MAELTVAGATEVIVGPGVPRPLLPERDARSKVAVITQPAATERAMEIAAMLGEEGLAVEVIGLPDRDEAKTLDVVASIYQALAGAGLNIHDTVVGVGGGAVSDVAGFVAGTWMRGVEVVHFPTTYLGAIDASIGGKTGVNIGGKNLVGVFWHPSRVVVDTLVLESLPVPLVREGMAEAYKAGLVGDPELVALFDGEGLSASVEEVVVRALSVKTRLVGEDPRDRGDRAFLNFGHTIGHAIEYASRLSHGESVALGMVAAVRVSEKKEDFKGADQVIATLDEMGLPVAIDGVDRARVLDLVSRDKKRDAGGVRMVLLRSVGDPVLVHVDRTDLEYALDSVGI